MVKKGKAIVPEVVQEDFLKVRIGLNAKKANPKDGSQAKWAIEINNAQGCSTNWIRTEDKKVKEFSFMCEDYNRDIGLPCMRLKALREEISKVMGERNREEAGPDFMILRVDTDELMKFDISGPKAAHAVWRFPAVPFEDNVFFYGGDSITVGIPVKDYHASTKCQAGGSENNNQTFSEMARDSMIAVNGFRLQNNEGFLPYIHAKFSMTGKTNLAQKKEFGRRILTAATIAVMDGLAKPGGAERIRGVTEMQQRYLFFYLLIYFYLSSVAFPRVGLSRL